MLSRIRDLERRFRVLDFANLASSSAKQFIRMVELLALPILLMSTLALVAAAVYRALAWSAMTHLITVPKDRIQAETQIFVTLGQILGGGFILTGLYFTGKSYVLARRGQLADRLASAIHGLGDENLERRVGSILSLGSMIGTEKDNTASVADILCSFIRTTTTAEVYRALFVDSDPRADIQAALTVLANARARAGWWRWIKIDLRGAVLSNAVFDTGDYRSALFQDCWLKNATFFRSRLARANFSRAVLDGSNFNQADLRHASLFRSYSPSSTFRRSNLIDANLTRAVLDHCRFDGARIIDCTFGQANLNGTSFRGARVKRGDYHKVDPEVLNQIRLGRSIEL